MWRPPEITASGGFFLLVGWFALSCGWDLAALVLGAAAIHELGHLLALKLCGGRVTRLRIGVLGAVMDVRGTMGYGGELLTTLAGPLANFLAAVTLGLESCSTAAGAHAVLCAFNLLPIPPLDGGRALEWLLVWAAGPQTADACLKWISRAAALALTGGAVWVMRQTGGSLWLLPPAAGVLWAAVRRSGTP